MDAIEPIAGIVKDVVPTVKKYVKYQICHNDYVNEFKEMQTQLKHRRRDVEKGLHAQLMQPGKIAKQEVEAWLEKAEQETAENVVEDLVCKGGCFTYICSSRKLDKRTQLLNEGIFKQGEKYTNAGESFVVDDHSIEHCATVFREKQQRLKHQKEHIEANLKTQCMQLGKIARKEVEEWMEKAGQQIAIKVEDLISQRECSLSTNLEKNTEELKQMLEEGKEFTNAAVSLVIDDHSIKGVPLLVEECRGREDIQGQILEWLKGNEVTRIAVLGMGVSKDLNIFVQQEEKFDILKFQKRIASSLGLELKPEDHENETKLAGLISQKLRQGNSVLILDDVWQPFCLEDVGIPILDGNNGCKLVLTTQLEDVAHAMECEVIPVNPLPPKEALALFKKKVGSAVLSDGRIKRDIDPFLKQILQKCNGVPLAIVTEAKTMRGCLWKSTHTKWSKFEGIIKGVPLLVEEGRGRDDIQDQILEWLKGDEVTRIAVSGMGGVGKTTIMKQVHNQLLKEPKFNKVIWVKVSRNFDIIVQQKKKFDILKFQKRIASGLGLELKPEDHENETKLARLISQRLRQGNSVLILDDVWQQFCLEDVGIPILDGNNGCKEAMNWKGHDILDKLVDSCLLELVRGSEDRVSMHDLLREMALEISPQFLVKAGIALEKLPEEGEWRENLLKVSLMENHITEIPSSMPPPKCRILTTLLLSNNKISTIPEAFFEHMLGLKILDLSGNEKLHRLPSSISKLEKLTTLLLKGCNSLREVPSLSNLVGLKKLDLSWTSIKELPQGLNMLTNLKYLGLGGRLSETLDEQLQNLSKLQHLLINADPDAETEYEWETIGIWGKHQNLEYLDLYGLCNLNMVFGEVGAIAESAPLLAGTFSSLQNISVWECHKIKMLFSVKWLGYLQKLQIIVVFYCKQLEEIIGSESEGGEKVTLPKLERLELAELPQLKTICSGSLICDSIRKIGISGCENIESVFWSGFNPLSNLEYLQLYQLENLKSVFDEEGLGLSPLVPPTSFFSLKEVRVFGCNQLKKVFSSGWLLRYFQSLETIEVDGCLQMEELISSSVDEEEKVTLPKLQSLQLFELPQLKSICSRSSVLICDSIQILRIFECEKLKRIPLNFPLLDNAQSSHPSSLKEIVVWPKECDGVVYLWYRYSI
ncbi:hypothetical protein SLEP1_g53470 [Rubroshorea leprosula]|uniref:NB-ARC domain-containing protein n=1 Tax=Rubroshorea leprosula TaxID=152421 RepID=A0AAV5MCA4_9ROSI|nr:hypothetical protein SLEP1_g53470 [Rubroshorea leprosula]